MATHKRSLETAAPPDVIWSIWSDTSTWPAWNPDVRSISLDGPFANGTIGTMTTGAGTHSIHLENVSAGRSFELVTSPMPATVFRFHCEVDPSASGSVISQSVEIRGALGTLLGGQMGKRVASSFEPILAGLAQEAERVGNGTP
ncbi:MAG TPA: SRPBCC family protein [Chloroflexota bacterium]